MFTCGSFFKNETRDPFRHIRLRINAARIFPRKSKKDRRADVNKLLLITATMLLVLTLCCSIAEARVNLWVPLVINTAPPPPAPQPPLVIVQPQMPSSPQPSYLPPPPPENTPRDPAEKLEELKRLLDEGIITQKDYDETKQRILKEF